MVDVEVSGVCGDGEIDGDLRVGFPQHSQGRERSPRLNHSVIMCFVKMNQELRRSDIQR